MYIVHATYRPKQAIYLHFRAENILCFHILWFQHLHSSHCCTMYHLQFQEPLEHGQTLVHVLGIQVLNMYFPSVECALVACMKEKNAFGVIEIVFEQYLTIPSSLFYNFSPPIPHRPALLSSTSFLCH